MLCVNVRSKADMSQLNLSHGTNNYKLKNRKRKKTDMLTRIGKQSGRIRGVSHEEEKEGYGGKDWQKRKVLSLG